MTGKYNRREFLERSSFGIAALSLAQRGKIYGQDSDTIRIEAPSVEVGRYEKLELLIRVNRRYDNPFDPEEVDLVVVLNTPGGGQMTLPAFFCQDYERRKLNQGRGRENWYYPVGNSTWKARFAPMQTGTYFAIAREFTTAENDFWLGQFTIGPVGSGTIWLDELSLKETPDGPELLWEADVNRPVLGVYNQVDCFMLDELVEVAQNNGIYLMLCMLTRDLYMKHLSDDRSGEYETAIQYAKKFMRYAVARWGYSTSVAAWEYFNEIDPGLPTDRFYTEVGDYLEQIDIYHHLRATSTWHPSAKDCRHPSLDIAQVHRYMRPGTEEEYKDEVAVVLDRAQFLRKHAPNKPALIAEFGLADTKWGRSDYMKQDTEGVHFHSSLWASAFAGTSGTAMFWWWELLDQQDAYRHYRPLSAFLADVCFTGLRQTDATVSDEQLRLLGYQGDDSAYIWISDSRSTWWSQIVENRQSTPVADAAIEIQGLRPGKYRLEWWDTYEGRTIRTEQVSCTEGRLHIPVPSFSRDIACKIRQ